MRIQIDQSLIDVGLSDIRKFLEERVNKQQKSPRRQGMATDILIFLSLQVFIPIIVSLTSTALYDVLKGKVLGQLSSKDTQKILAKFCNLTINTHVTLSDEGLKALKDELSPLGLTEADILAMYNTVTDALEKKGTLSKTSNVDRA